MVLVYDFGDAADGVGGVQGVDYFVAQVQAEDSAREEQEYTVGDLRCGDEESGLGGLVDSADVGHKHGSTDLSGGFIGIGEENRSEFEQSIVEFIWVKCPRNIIYLVLIGIV